MTLEENHELVAAGFITDPDLTVMDEGLDGPVSENALNTWVALVRAGAATGGDGNLVRPAAPRGIETPSEVQLPGLRII